MIPAVPAGQTAEVADGLAPAPAIGKPRGGETPLSLPGRHAVAFGDAVVGSESCLCPWNQNGAAAG
jgi:hypothetical protein